MIVQFSILIQLERLKSSLVLFFADTKVGVQDSSQAIKSSFDEYNVIGDSELLVTFIISDFVSHGLTLNSCLSGDIDRLAIETGINEMNTSIQVIILEIFIEKCLK